MSWGKLDDQFHAHRKAKRAWQGHPRALGLHLLAMSYCAGQLTDGLVDDEFVVEKVPSKAERVRVTAVLVDAGLWNREDDGWRINDWLDFNPSRAEVEESRGVDRFRKDLTRDTKLIAAIRDRDGDVCRYCAVQVDWKDRRSSIGGTYDHVTPVSKGGQNTFDNVVVACRGCNQRKGARSPAEAGMNLAGPSRDLAAGQIGSSPLPAQVSNSRPDPSHPLEKASPSSSSLRPDPDLLENADPNVVRLSRGLATLVTRRDPKAIVKPDGKTWLKAMRLLIADRGGDVAEVERVMRWAHTGWWGRVILSPGSLREKFTQLVAAMADEPLNANGDKPAPNGRGDKYDRAAGLIA